jgi:hypothetical protein
MRALIDIGGGYHLEALNFRSDHSSSFSSSILPFPLIAPPGLQLCQSFDYLAKQEVLKDAEKQVQMVRESLKVAQTRQKSYADKRRRDLSFEVGDFVYLKVSPMRGTRRFNVKGKLAPRYVGPFKIIDRKGEVAYQLEFPP